VNMTLDAAVNPEQEVARDLSRRALMVLPAFLLVGALFDGLSGAASAALALALVALNFRLGAAIIARAMAISLNALYGAVLFGYLFRLGFMTAVVLVVRNGEWFATVPFAITLLITHLGLLTWETKHVAASLAFPGLAPTDLKPQE
jgi:hypothetical protein